jgi:hypothetical protein
MEALLETLDAKLQELTDEDMLDLMRSRGREQEVLDILDESASR